MSSSLVPSDNEMPSSGSESEGKKKKKRGATRLPHLAKENNPKKKQIEYNYKNQAIGAHRVELSSYIGMEVKRSLSLRYPGEWSEVPESEKNKLWEDITMHYEIHETFHKQTIAACGRSFRDWKFRLAEAYIYPYEGNRRKLKKLPKGYPFIKQDDWNRFVKHRLSPDYKKKRDKYIELRKKNKYPHRMGRRGYAGFEEKLIKDGTFSSDETIDRSLLWKKARENKNGDFEGSDLQSVVNKIDEYSKQINEGSIFVEGKKDALTLALGTPEHDGRVRGAGKDVTPNNYFHKPPRREPTAKTQDAEIQALKQQVHEQQLNLEKQKLDFETEKLNWQREMEERINARFQKMEKGMNLQVSKGTNVSLPSLPSGKATVRSSVGSRQQSTSHQSEPCKLAVNSPSNIVALGTVFHGQNMIHSVLLPKNHLVVSVDIVFDTTAILPRPTKEAKLVEDAKFSFVGWPKHLVLFTSTNIIALYQLGVCEGGLNFTCNNKLIGARFYPKRKGGSTRDIVGHGSHTASIAAGNSVMGVSFFDLAKRTTRRAVPASMISVYKVCDPKGCSSIDILASFYDAIADGVGVLSVSLGSFFPSPFYYDSVAIGSFYAKGKIVVCEYGDKGKIVVCEYAVNNGGYAMHVGAIAYNEASAISLLK